MIKDGRMTINKLTHPLVGNEAEIFERLLSDKGAIKVDYLSLGISCFSLFSFDYSNCNGVALLNQRHGALSHFDLICGDPDKYLRGMIDDFIQMSGNEGIAAVLVGGDKDHFTINKNILRRYRIPVVGFFLDGYDDKDMLIIEGEEGKGEKGIVVVPEQRLVVMCSEIHG